MFDLSDPLVVRSLLDVFLVPVALWQRGSLIRGGVWVEYPHVKKCPLESATPKAVSSDIQSGTVLSYGRAEAPRSASPVRGWRCGSTATLWHTSVMRWAVKSLISL